MGVKGGRRRIRKDEPSALKDIPAILQVAKDKGFIQDYEVNIERIIENEGILILKDFEMESAMAGLLYMDKEEKRWVIKVNAKHHIKRQRLTMAHEFAHYCLHKDEQGSFVDEEMYFRKDHESSIEYNADSFAYGILIPEDLFRKAIQVGIRKIKELSDMFNVSTTAIKIRAEKLGFKTKSNEKQMFK